MKQVPGGAERTVRWQPASVDTHTVRVPSPYGIRTLSIDTPSSVAKRAFTEPSLDFCSVLRTSSLKGRSPSKSCLNATAMFSMAPKLSFRSL